MRYTYEDIISGMKNSYEERANASVNSGSDEEKMLEALATELFSLSCYGDFILKQAFVQSATGEYLDRHGELRACTRKAGSKATGELCFSVFEPLESDVIISAGTVCSVQNQPLLQYVTTESTTLVAGELSATAQAEAVDVGRRFNLPEGAVTVMVNAPVSIAGVVNTTAFNGGYDGESDNAYRRRIIDMFKVPTVFTSKRETENKIRQIDGVIDCAIVRAEKPSCVKIILRTIYAEYPMQLIWDVTDRIGINTFVDSEIFFGNAREKNVSISASVKLKPSSDAQAIKQRIENIIEEHFSGEKIGESIAISPILKEVFSIDEVEKLDLNCNEMRNDIISCDVDEYIHLDSPVVICYE